MKLVKYEPPVDPYDQFLFWMWMMYWRAPRKREAEASGHYDLGEIGCVREKDWARLTPYSIARPEQTNG